MQSNLTRLLPCSINNRLPFGEKIDKYFHEDDLKTIGKHNKLSKYRRLLNSTVLVN